MNWLVSFTLVLISLQASAGVVTVSSVYEDLTDASRRLKVNGSGLIFAHASKHFVATASHVSQGTETKIELNGRMLAITGRMLHKNNDLELFEVTGAPANEVHAFVNNGTIEYDAAKAGRRRWIDSYNYVLLNEWVNDPNLDADNAFAQTRSSVLGLDIFAIMLSGGTLVQPGTSGAPLLTVIPEQWSEPILPYDAREWKNAFPKGRTFVRGIAIRRDRFFAHAAFVPEPRVMQLLKAYEENTPWKIELQWKANGPLLMRMNEFYHETSGMSTATAGGTITDVGNGVTMEGGDLASLGEDSPNEFLDKVSAFPSLEGESMMFWLVAARHPRTKFLINYWSWFDMELFPVFTGGIDMTALFFRESPTLKLGEQLQFRFGKGKEFEITSPIYLKVDAAGAHFRVPVGNGDELQFELNPAGIYCPGGVCRSRFQPVIEVVSGHGAVYLVDLREFYFVDTASTRTLVLRKPGAESFTREQIIEAMFDEMQAEVMRPRISYRLKRNASINPMTVEEGQKRIIDLN